MRDEPLRQTIQERAVEIIGAFVHLKLQGRQYVGVCPFHADMRPSLSVVRESGERTISLFWLWGGWG